MPSLPTTIVMTIETANDLTLSKANQDNFGTTYRGSLSTATQRVVAVCKVMHREEGPSTSRKERHIVDCSVEHFPADGSPSYVEQSYIHQIRRKGESSNASKVITDALANMLDASHADGSAVLNWGV